MDAFGSATITRPWNDASSAESLDGYLKRVDVHFEFLQKLGIEFYAFHDRDVAPEGANWRETNHNLDVVVEKLLKKQQETGIKLLWGTANLFSHRRYMNGASTNPNPEVFAFAAAQVKKAMEVFHDCYIYGGGFVFSAKFV
jgi:xylose isomerase